MDATDVPSNDVLHVLDVTISKVYQVAAKDGLAEDEQLAGSWSGGAVGNILGTNDEELCWVRGGPDFIRYNEGGSDFSVIGEPTGKAWNGEAIVDANMFGGDGYNTGINIDAIVVRQKALDLYEL
jgi:hypothetical protein